MPDILSKILAKKDTLTKKEQKLATYILKEPKQVVKLSIHQLATNSQVSAATITRFCHSLGLKGYSHLRLKISASLPQLKEDSYQEIVSGERPETIIKKMKTRFETVIQTTEVQLSDRHIQDSVRLLHTAPRIEIFGVGAGGIVAQDLYQKMIRIGKNVNFFLDFHVALTEVVVLPKNSVIILISNSGETYETVELAQRARENNISIILITSNLNSAAAKYADIVLLNQDLGESKIRLGATTSLVSQMFISDVLLLSYSATYLDEVSEGIDKSKKAVEKFKLKK